MKWKVKTRFVPFSIRTYSQLLLNVNEESTQLSIEEALKDEIFKKGGLNIYRVILQGKRKPELFLIPEKLKSFGNITEVLDETRPAYDLEELQKKYAGTLIGDYICFFMEKTEIQWKISLVLWFAGTVGDKTFQLTQSR